MERTALVPGEIVQLSPVDVRNKAFAGCMMVVTEPKGFGAQGYVQGLGTREAQCGQAYYRAFWEEMEQTGGRAEWVVGSLAEGEQL